MDMEARQLRQEMKRRGHITIPKRGEDPEQVQQMRLYETCIGTGHTGRASVPARSRSEQAGRELFRCR